MIHSTVDPVVDLEIWEPETKTLREVQEVGCGEKDFEGDPRSTK